MSSGYRVLPAADAFWRPSNATRVLNTDLARQLEADGLGARMWRLAPGQTITKHRHRTQVELYVLLEGTGRVRIGDDVLTLEQHSALLVEPRTVRQVFNDTPADALWLVCGAPPEAANTLEMSEDELADLYPDGPTARPPELDGDRVDPRVRASFDRQSFMRTLGATLEEAGAGRVTIRLPRTTALDQQHGYLHAGALLSIVDSCCGYAALSVAPPDHEVLTAELKVNLLAPAAGEAVVAHGRVVRAGRTLCVCQGDAYDADDPGRHLATMLATIAIVGPR